MEFNLPLLNILAHNSNCTKAKIVKLYEMKENHLSLWRVLPVVLVSCAVVREYSEARVLATLRARH
jgi:hypothetical protein